MQPDDTSEIFVEAIEVLLNHILYVRGVYPQFIFKKRRIYNTPVFVSIYPPLNTYLGNVLRSAQELLQRQALESFEVIIFHNECDHLESYVFELQPMLAKRASLIDDQYLLQYEQQLRAALYKLSERVKQLPQLTADVKFKVQLQTTQACFLNLTHDAQYQEFPWLQSSAVIRKEQLESRTLRLLPLATVENLGIKMQAQIFN